jgi:hypothetical protein
MDPRRPDRGDLGQGSDALGRWQVAGPDIELVTRDKGVIAQAAAVQGLLGPGLGLAGHLLQGTDDVPAALLPVHRVGRRQISLLRKADDKVRAPLAGEPIQQGRLDLDHGRPRRRGRQRAKKEEKERQCAV